MNVYNDIECVHLQMVKLINSMLHLFYHDNNNLKQTKKSHNISRFFTPNVVQCFSPQKWWTRRINFREYTIKGVPNTQATDQYRSMAYQELGCTAGGEQEASRASCLFPPAPSLALLPELHLLIRSAEALGSHKSTTLLHLTHPETNPAPQSMEKLSSMKPLCSVKKAGTAAL